MIPRKTRTTILLNWYGNPYHCPLFVAQGLGFFEEAGLQVALLEPNNPSDVTEIVGRGDVDFGLKAIIHTLVARGKGYQVRSLGTLLDEPPTGFLSLKKAEIRSFEDFRGKRIGYIGEFGKTMVEDLAKRAGMQEGDFEPVKVGMNLTDALLNNRIDTGIGFVNFQKVELEAHGEVDFLRIDELAGLGCCCFCSVLYIANDELVRKDPGRYEALLAALHRGTAFTTENPDEALEVFFQQKPQLRNETFKKIFYRSLPFFSRTLANVERDWAKVGAYGKHLGVVPENFQVEDCYSNSFIPNVPHCSLAAL